MERAVRLALLCLCTASVLKWGVGVMALITGRRMHCLDSADSEGQEVDLLSSN